jgi:hypothetical protein
LEGDFRALELSSKVDSELEKLQQELIESSPKMLGRSSSTPMRSYQEKVSRLSTG